MPCWGSTAVALSQSRKGVTCWVIPIVSALLCIICHIVSGARNGDTISGCTKEKGESDARGTETLSGRWVSAGSRGYPGARRTSSASIYVASQDSHFFGASHTGWTNTVAGSRLRRIPSSRVGWAKDGVTNCFPQSTHMCGFGASRQTTSGGLSSSRKVTSLSSRAWGVVLAHALRRVKTPKNPRTMGSGDVASTPAMVLLVQVTCARVG